MKYGCTRVAFLGLLALVGPAYDGSTPAVAAPPTASQTQPGKENQNVKPDASTFLRSYQESLSRLDVHANLTAWKAANTGREEDFAASAQAALELCKFHSSREGHQIVQQLLANREQLAPLDRRALELAAWEYRRNQLPPELLERMVKLAKEIERTFGTFRGELDGRQLSNNELLDLLQKENASPRREAIWKALKAVGAAVAPQLVELAKLRNEAARSLGFANFWEMEIRLQEHDPAQLLAIFDELERLTREPFRQVKTAIDRRLAERFQLPATSLMPWHYDNPFFQDAPPSDQVDLNEFYRHKSREEIVEIARVFFRDLGLPVDSVLRRSDLYERPGKDQHAFCTDIDHAGDVRILCNVKPTAEWMDTTLHELGHAVYDLYVDRQLPYNVRTPAHAFTTEGVAMLCGSLGKNPTWMIARAGADRARVERVSEAIIEQRRREQLVFARWAIVMLRYEKALYENPQQDLNALWWDEVTRIQLLRRPADRNAPDWASKPHFTIAPVYYHNYLLGELFAAQLRHALSDLVKHQGKPTELQLERHPEIGEFLKRRVFWPAATLPWPEYVRQATGEPLTARYFATEVGGP